MQHERNATADFHYDLWQLSFCSVAHLHAFEEGYAEEREDEDGSGAKIGSKEWLKAWKQAIIKKSSEEGFQDKAIRVTVSLISVAIMLIMLYGAIGLLSGQGVKQLPCETTRELARARCPPDAGWLRACPLVRLSCWFPSSWLVFPPSSCPPACPRAKSYIAAYMCVSLAACKPACSSIRVARTRRTMSERCAVPKLKSVRQQHVLVRMHRWLGWCQLRKRLRRMPRVTLPKWRCMCQRAQ